MAKNKTQKEDKDKYRPWRTQSNTCIGCGRGLGSEDKRLWIACTEKVSEGYDIC